MGWASPRNSGARGGEFWGVGFNPTAVRQARARRVSMRSMAMPPIANSYLIYRWQARAQPSGMCARPKAAIGKRFISSWRKRGTGAGGCVDIQPHLGRSPAHSVIPKRAKDVGSDTIVMATLSRSGIAGVIIGNTAEDILNRVSCSVLAVKTPGYVSPIQP